MNRAMLLVVVHAIVAAALAGYATARVVAGQRIFGGLLLALAAAVVGLGVSVVGDE